MGKGQQNACVASSKTPEPVSLRVFALVSDACSPPQVPDWWIWAYWLSPYSWGMRSLVVNEFTSPPWRYPYNFNASYLTPGQSYTVGEAALMSFAFYTGREWVWAGVGYLLGFVMLCAGISSLALQVRCMGRGGERCRCAGIYSAPRSTRKKALAPSAVPVVSCPRRTPLPLSDKP